MHLKIERSFILRHWSVQTYFQKHGVVLTASKGSKISILPSKFNSNKYSIPAYFVEPLGSTDEEFSVAKIWFVSD